MKNTSTIIGILALIVVIGIGAYVLTHQPAPTAVTPNQPAETTTATTTEQSNMTVIGKSVEGRDITAYHFGSGSDEILVVGGIHGGYEWNTVVLSYDLMDYLTQHPEAVPQNEKVTIVPVLNPDGLNKVVDATKRFTEADITETQTQTIPGRFNANNVDLNRNFDCDWKATGTWQSRSVSGGTAAFSEPETQAVKSYMEAHTLTAVIAFYSSAGGVYASNCHGGVLPETNTILKAYADASGYPAFQDFNFYDITGDMVNWFAKEKIPAISIVLTNHTDAEWDKNQKGITAVLNHYAK
jgi:murein tripeptide amidase MpaA